MALTRMTIMLRKPFIFLSLAWLFLHPAHGNETPNEVAPFATVMRLRGTITMGEDANAKVLAEGDKVLVGQRVRADKNAEALLKTADAGFVALRPGAEFLMERYVAIGQDDDHMSLRLIRGGLRMITGWIGKKHRRNYQVATPWGTVGIRGTDHEPYVLTSELASELAQSEGTYDKVNQGGTTLESNGGSVSVDPGKVGFSKAIRRRALITLILPVLLERVPDFFVPGSFDDELERLSASNDVTAQLQTAALRNPLTDSPKPGNPSPPPVASHSTAPTAVATVIEPSTKGTDSCAANQVGTRWLAALDSAIQRRDTATIVAMFAPDVQITATVNGGNGSPTQILLEASEFASSATAAMLGLSDYSQRRPTISARPQSSISCSRIVLNSVVIEQGRQGGRSYRFESIEDYVLELRGNAWIAIEARTQQR